MVIVHLTTMEISLQRMYTCGTINSTMSLLAAEQLNLYTLPLLLNSIIALLEALFLLNYCVLHVPIKCDAIS
jgi:hypothetical protein